jgi:D-alanine-D-alanine ligase
MCVVFLVRTLCVGTRGCFGVFDSVRVAVLHNAVPDDAPPEDQDTLIQVATVVAALTRLGHEPTTVSCTLDLAALHDELLRLRPDVVFNLVESLAQADSLVYLPLAVLDVLHLPYTGSRTESLFLTTHKVLAKERLRSAGLPTPPWIACDGAHHMKPPSADCAAQRWIVKGVWEQGSRDMEDDAVLEGVDLPEVQKRLAQRAAQSARPCFAEQFVEGREFNLSVLAGPHGPEPLPPAEIDFSAFPPEKPHIVGHRAKWQADSFEYHHTPHRFDFGPNDGPLLDQLARLTKQCWILFRLRGWVRVDFRVDAAGQPWILEINANPCLSSDAGFAASLQRTSITFDDAIQRILEDSAP